MPICKGCGQEIIWIKTKNGKNTPIDAKEKLFYYQSQKLESGWGQFSAGHESHWATCPVANNFKSKG